MLNTIRKQAGSWVVKALLLVLVASFAVWGIGDIFYGGGRNPTVATVGDSEILATELATEFNQTLDQVQRRLGTGIDRERAIQLGLMQRALQDLVARRLIDLRAHDMGLAVDEATLRTAITQNPVFQTGGRFDRSRFEQLLRANGLSEDGYLAALRQDVVRRMLTESLTAPIEVPQSLAEALYRHRHEQRAGRMLEVTADSIADVPEPSEAELAEYHEEHQDRFRAPQYRKVTFVTLEPEDLLAEVQITQADIEAAYEARSAQYRTPERREVAQLLASARDPIERAAKRLEEGQDLETVAGQIEGVTLTDLGEVSRGQLPATLEDAIFALDEGEASGPVESGFGWHLFEITSVTPEEVVPLAEVEDEIRRELALEEARARLPSLANALDDELAAGARLEEAAATLGLEIETVAAIDRSGQSPKGERPPSLPQGSLFLEVAFESPKGETSLLEETEDGSYFVLRVDEVTPSRIQSVDEVRDELIAAWRADKRRELAKARAQELLEERQRGAPFEEVAADAGLEPVAIGPLKRTAGGPAQGVAQAAVRALFSVPPGEVADEVVSLGEGFAVVRTDEVIEADPADAPEGVARLRDELRGDMRADLLAQFERSLREAYPVEIDMAEVNRLMEQDGMPPARHPAPMPTGGGGIF